RAGAEMELEGALIDEHALVIPERGQVLGLAIHVRGHAELGAWAAHSPLLADCDPCRANGYSSKRSAGDQQTRLRRQHSDLQRLYVVIHDAHFRGGSPQATSGEAGMSLRV